MRIPLKSRCMSVENTVDFECIQFFRLARGGIGKDVRGRAGSAKTRWNRKMRMSGRGKGAHHLRTLKAVRARPRILRLMELLLADELLWTSRMGAAPPLRASR